MVNGGHHHPKRNKLFTMGRKEAEGRWLFIGGALSDHALHRLPLTSTTNKWTPVDPVELRVEEINSKLRKRAREEVVPSIYIYINDELVTQQDCARVAASLPTFTFVKSSTDYLLSLNPELRSHSGKHPLWREISAINRRQLVMIEYYHLCHGWESPFPLWTWDHLRWRNFSDLSRHLHQVLHHQRFCSCL